MPVSAREASLGHLPFQNTITRECYIPFIPLMSIPLIELSLELKKRKKLEPTSIALPAASAASIALTEVMPLLPSAAGQSLCCSTSTGLTSHQIALLLTRE